MKNNLYKAALLAALGIGSIMTAKAVNNDVLLGFNDLNGPSTAQNDYVIDLGAASLFTTTATLDLSSSFTASIFATAFGTDAQNLNNVAVGAIQGFGSAYPKTVFTTSGKASLSSSQLSGAAGLASSVALGEYGSTANLQGWSEQIAQSPTLGGLQSANFANNAGSPMQYLNNGVVSETLEMFSQSSLTGARVQTVLGTLLINANTDTITFTGAASAVPEPSTYGLVAGAGLLLVSLRNRFSRKNA